MINYKVCFTFVMNFNKISIKTYLPYYFRKIGIFFVLVAIVISFIGGINDFAKGVVKGNNWGQSHNSGMFPTKQTDKVIDTPLHYKEILSSGISNTLNWIGITLSFSGFLLYIFSKEKTEDELIQKLRYPKS